MIIEFIGVMGAGKTTLHRHALKRLGALGWSTWTPTMIAARCPGRDRTGKRRMRGRQISVARCIRLIFKARVAWASRAVVLLAAHHLLRSGRSVRDASTALRRFLTCLVNHRTARLIVPRDQIVLADEGVVQKMCSVFVHGNGEIDLGGVRRYARTLPLPDVLIYLTVDAEIAKTRVQNRSRRLAGRFALLQDAQLRLVFADTVRAFDALVDEIRATAPHAVKIVIVQTNDLERAKATLDAQIASLTLPIYDAA